VEKSIRDLILSIKAKGGGIEVPHMQKMKVRRTVGTVDAFGFLFVCSLG
jgi:hypothetical protein